MKDKSTRSNSYQHLFKEISFDNLELLSEVHPDLDVCEEIKELNDELIVAIFDIMQQNLTENQYKIITLMSKGLTQWEIADEMSCNQSSIHKSMFGNPDYKNLDKKGNPCIWGGSAKKILKAIKTSEIIKIIMRKIEALLNNQV